LGGECAGSITLSKEEKEKEYSVASRFHEELPFESKKRKFVIQNCLQW